MLHRTLDEEVRTFATNLSSVLVGALPEIGLEPLRVLLDNRGRHITIRQADQEGIGLFISGRRHLGLKLSYRCVWNSDKEFLAVDDCTYALLPAGLTEPLFRYHFRRAPDGGLPSAHLHVHAHRDEALALMLGGKDAGRVRDRLRKIDAGKFPQLASLHFPLGGPRFRPGIEDVVDMIRVEFGIDVAQGIDDALWQGRTAYRQMQLAAAVSDDPLVAAAELERLGYEIRDVSDTPREVRPPRF